MTDAEALVKRLNSMSASELEAERRRGQARTDAIDIERYGRPITAELQGRKVEMTHYRADAAPTMKAVVHTDMTGRKITEFRGGSMREWMGQFMTDGFRQLGIFYGSTPEQERDFRQRMQRKLAELGSR